MKRLYSFFLIIPLLIACFFGLYSLVDKDKAISEKENRGLKQKPSFSFSSFLSGDYMEELEEYYKDQFPLREQLIEANTKLNLFYMHTSSDSTVMIQYDSNAGAGGIGGAKTEETTQSSSGSENPLSQDEKPESGEEVAPPVQKDPELDDPDNAQTLNSMIYVNGRAMEVVYENKDLESRYANAVNTFAELMPNVNVYSLITPNSTQFYSPSDIREGSNTNEKNMIDYIYSNMNSSVTCVDAYSKLRSRVDEYIYFRTDHHWTQTGAYYAYTAYCEAAGLTPVPLSQFETGRVTCSQNGADTFLGTLYSNLSSYPVQRAEMEANPDYCQYYFPVSKCNDTAYAGLYEGNYVDARNYVTTVARSVYDTYLYMAFISGDQPISIIDTDVDNDKVVMVVKESYGNAFVPFLTSHYSKVVVVDPREFNANGKYALYLPDLAEKEGVTDLIVINYPFMPQNSYYINRLRNLGGLSSIS